MIPKEAVRSCRDLSRALRSKRRDPQEGGLHEADVHHLPARPPGRANAWGHSCEHVRGTPPKASPPQPRRLDELPDELSPDDDHHDGELHFMSLSGEGRSSVAVCLHRSSAPP